MVSPVSNLAQQAIANPIQQRGEDTQRQINQRESEQATFDRPPSGSQTQPVNAPSAQTESSSNQTPQNPTQQSVSEFRAQSGLEQNSTPPRGSFVDISA